MRMLNLGRTQKGRADVCRIRHCKDVGSSSGDEPLEVSSEI